METFDLICHPAHPTKAVTRISARALRLDANWLTLRWSVEGARDIVVPPFAGRARADGLWQTTCFELFVKARDATGYAEFNLSPSERWAAYDFAGYRADMAERPVPRAPVCTPRRGGTVLIFDAAIPAGALPPLPWDYGLTAVIEEEGGVRSFWAIAHPAEKPDFHDPACFAARLAAPDAP
ncbi:MAG: DOMON-like domain-containing protein [Novosphingobium sp.]